LEQPHHSLIGVQSPSIIIVGISKEFVDLRKLLGAHTWSKFLQSPAPEENGRVTRIYFSSLGTDLQLTKVGAYLTHIGISMVDPNPCQVGSESRSRTIGSLTINGRL
jgi:hypothetical protein